MVMEAMYGFYSTKHLAPEKGKGNTWGGEEKGKKKGREKKWCTCAVY